MSDSEQQRFGITDLGVGVEEYKLQQIRDVDSVAEWDKAKRVIVVKVKSTTDQGLDSFEYEIQLDPFRIIQKINGITTMIVNHKDTLYFENSSFFKRQFDYYPANDQDCVR